MATTEYMTSQTYSATIGGTVYNVTANLGTLPGQAGWYNVLGYGAVEGGITDCTGAIEAAASAAAAAGGVLHIPKGTWAIASSTYIPSGCDVVMDGLLLYTGAGNETALVIGETNTPNRRRRIQVNVVKGSTITGAEVDWTSDTSVGVDIKCPDVCVIDVKLIQYFTTGLMMNGDSAGCAYNTVHVGHIGGCQTSILLTNRDGGWCNQNTFIGGRIATTTAAVNLANSRTGIKITSTDGTYLNNNNNTFYNTSLEISHTGVTGTAVPIHIEHGLMNEWRDIRVEQNTGNSDPIAVVENESRDNVIHTGYDNRPEIGAAVTDTTTSRNTIVRRRIVHTQEDTLASWSSGNLAERAYEQDGAGKVAVRGMHIGAQGGTTTARANTGVTVSGSTLVTTIAGRTVGVCVDTRCSKRFVVRRDTPDKTKPGRISVRCYDAAGAIIEDPDGAAGTTYVKSLSGNSLTYVVADKWYKTGADSDKDYYILVTDDVKYIDLEFGAGSAVMHLNAFSIESIDHQSAISVFSGNGGLLTGGDHNNMLATAPPATAGTGIYYERGMIIHNVAATVGQPIGWMCSVAGAPGTWVALANL